MKSREWDNRQIVGALWMNLLFAFLVAILAIMMFLWVESIELQAEQTSVTRARDTQRLKDFVEYGDCYKCHPRRDRIIKYWSEVRG